METEKPNKADEIIRLIDERLAEESTLQDGLEWAVRNNWMSEAEADQCLRLFRQNLDSPNS